MRRLGWGGSASNVSIAALTVVCWNLELSKNAEYESIAGFLRCGKEDQLGGHAGDHAGDHTGQLETSRKDRTRFARDSHEIRMVGFEPGCRYIPFLTTKSALWDPILRPGCVSDPQPSLTQCRGQSV